MKPILKDGGMATGIQKNNRIGPEGVESGPDAPEDWYLTYPNARAPLRYG